MRGRDGGHVQFAPSLATFFLGSVVLLVNHHGQQRRLCVADTHRSHRLTGQTQSPSQFAFDAGDRIERPSRGTDGKRKLTTAYVVDHAVAIDNSSQATPR